MLEHEQLWNAIDALAKMHGYSTSGLAKKSGLDATIFNKSKRISNDGRLRWPTTESIAKVLESTGQSMGQFAVLMQNNISQHDGLALPQTKLSSLQNVKGFVSPKGNIIQDNRDEFSVNTNIDKSSFSVRINSSDYTPMYKKGEILIASIAQGTIRRGDKVIIALSDKKNIIAIVNTLSPYTIKISSVGDIPLENTSISTRDIMWMARILWKAEF